MISRKQTHQVNITELVEPEVVYCRGDEGEVVPFKPTVGIVHSSCKSTENPPIHDGLTA